MGRSRTNRWRRLARSFEKCLQVFFGALLRMKADGVMNGICMRHFTLRDLPVGTGYAVWTGTGAVGAAIAGIVLLGDSAALTRLLPIGLIAVGIVWLALAE